MAEEPDGVAHGHRQAERRGRQSDLPPVLSWVPKIGIGAWSFVGFVAATAIVFAALGAVSEIVLPMTFAAVLAVIFKPLVGVLKRHKLKPSAGAGLIVLGLATLTIGVMVATVRACSSRRIRSARRSTRQSPTRSTRPRSTRPPWMRPGRRSRTQLR